jgi:hypothetical protein
MGVRDLDRGVTGVGLVAGEHLVQQDACRVHVRAGVGATVRDELGRQIGHRAHQKALGRGVAGGADRTGQTEVGDLYRALVGDQHVLGLDVAVDDTRVVRGRERGQDRGEQIQRSRGGEGRLLADHVTQRAAGDVLHRQEQGAVVVTLVEHRDHVRVREAGGGPGLGHEPAGELGVVTEPVVHHLERDGPVQPHVEGLVDRGHPALGDAGTDAVPSVEHSPDEAVADLRVHVVRHLR